MLTPNRCNKKCCCLLLYCFFFLAPPVFAQYPTEKDSLLQLLKTLPDDTNKVNVLNRLCFICRTNDSEKALEYCKGAIGLANKLKFTFGLALAKTNLGKAYRILKKYKKAIKIQLSVLEDWREIKDSIRLAEVFRELGINYRRIGEYPRSLAYFFMALKIYKENDIKIGLGHTCASIGMLYYKQKKYDQALRYHKSALNTHKILNEENSIAIDYNNLGNVYSDLQEYKRALFCYRKYREIKEKLLDFRSVAIALSNIGYVYAQQRKHKLAIGFYKKSLYLRDSLGQNRTKLYPLQYLAESHAKLKEHEKAYKYGLQALEIAREVGEKHQAMEITKSLSKIYQKAGKYQQALEYYQQFKVYQDSIFNDKKSRQIVELETKYETGKKEQENKFLKIEDSKNKALIKQGNRLSGAIGVGALLLVVLAVVLYRSNRRKQQSNQLLRTQKQAIETQSNQLEQQAEELKTANHQLSELSTFKSRLTHMIIHDLKNPLASILGLVNSHTEGKLDKVHLVATTQRMLHMVQNILDVQKAEEAELHWDLKELVIGDVIQEVIAQQRILANAKNITLRYDTQVGDIVKAEGDILLRVLSNLLSNAIKFTPENGEVSLHSDYQGQYLKISVTDTGIGIPAHQLPKVFDKFHSVAPDNQGNFRSTGLGLTFCKMAIEKQGGSIGVVSVEGKGSTFWFTLPLVAKATTPQSGSPIQEVDNIIIKTIHQTLAQLQGNDLELVRAIVQQIRKQNLDHTRPTQLARVFDVAENKVSINPAVKNWMYMLLQEATNQALFEELLTLPTR